MSPRRKLQPREEPFFSATPPRRPRRWGLPAVAMLAAAIAAAAITMCAAVLNSHEAQRRTTLRQAAALSYVCSFMTEFASPDAFHANEYTDRVLAEATGDFADQYRHNQNQILIQVASAEPTTGSVLEAGISRSNDDGSIDVLVMTKFTSKSPDGKFQLERANRWVVTATQEGGSWKISNLTPMI